MSDNLTRRALCASALALTFVCPALAAAELSGTVVWRERMALPEGAVLWIVVEDVSRADAPSHTVVSGLFEAGPGSPVAFRLPLPDTIDPRLSHNLRARLVVDGRVWFMSTEHVPVTGPAQGLTVPVQRMQNAQLVQILTGTWRVADTPQGVAANVSFGLDGRAAGSTGCNRFSGSYTAKGDALQFGHMISTRMACAPAAMDYESRFLAALAATQHHAFADDGTTLQLLNHKGEDLLTLVRDPGPD